jgi:predicted aminopeptidase
MKKQSFKKIIQRTLWGALAIIILLCVLYFNLILYGIQQGIGQLRIVWNAQSFEDFLERGNHSDSLKVYRREKIDLIQEIKQFAIDSLGLRASASYTKIYDQKGKPILWAVSAAEPFALKPKEWDYGPMGRMPNKGFFDSTKAYHLVKELKAEKYDVNIYAPSAWSTLGWFSDPVLSNMLYWSEGELAGLIMHEMTHATIWIKGNVEYNENLADFIGDTGALMFLAHKYGKTSKEYRKHTQANPDYEKFYNHILRGAEKLDTLYQSFKEKDSFQSKTKRKEAMIRQIVETLDTLPIKDKKRFQKRFKKEMPNNAYFMLFRRYRAKQNQFEEAYKKQFKANLKMYIAYLKKKY